MQPCTLEVGGRVVVESAGGPLEAEYALFDAGGIELLSDGPGTIREAGYLTTAHEALIRLDAAGITDLFSAEVASAIQPTLSTYYALGPSAKKMAAHLGPGELFESRVYEAGVRQYVGRWLDLQAMARESNVLRATAVLQAAFLCALLCEVPPETRVFMSTLGYTRDRRPGERTYRRVQLETAPELPAALRALGERPLGVVENRANGPSRTELLEAVNVRAAACATEQGRERLLAIARALMVREVPARGPLADPQLWALEGRLSHGDSEGVVAELDAIEKARGRLPGTAYLRARAALMLGTEKPLAIAERVSSLSASMNMFFELELLAAEAWKAAGDGRKAKAFARDLVENPNAPDELRIRALDILDTRSSAVLAAAAPVPPPPSPSEPYAPPRQMSSRPPPAHPSSRPPPREASGRASAKGESRRPGSKSDSRRPGARPESRRPDARREEEAAEEEGPDTNIDPAPVVHVAGAESIESRFEGAPQAQIIEEPTMRDRIPAPLSKPPSPVPSVDDIPPPPRTPVMDPAGTNNARAGQQALRTTRPLRQTSTVPPPQQGSSRPPPPPQEVTQVSTAYTPADAIEARAEVVDAVPIPEEPIPHGHAPSPPPPPHAMALTTTMHSPQSPMFMRGASQPPFKHDSQAPPPQIPRTAPPPRNLNQPTELAEALSLPPGLHGQPPPRDELPTNVVDARVAFTHMSRELGREYRQRRRIELRTDTASIEAMQRYLHERIVDGQIKSHEDVHELRLHGAFLSEILARQLGAYWADIGPTELGYWAMIVGSSTRVFPFGRVLRYVQMGHKERDLVSYYLELEGRSRS